MDVGYSPKKKECCFEDSHTSSEENLDEKNLSKRKKEIINFRDKKQLIMIVLAILFYASGIVYKNFGNEKIIYILFLAVAYLISGKEVFKSVVKNIRKGNFLDENFLMMIATVGAVVIGEYPEAVGVMLFYNIGEYF